jgi:hypothetical protein
MRESRYTIAAQVEEKERNSDQQVLIPQEIVFHGGKEIISWLREYVPPRTHTAKHALILALRGGRLLKGEKVEHRFKVTRQQSMPPGVWEG